MFSVETNIDTDIDKYKKVSDLVKKHVNYYNFTVFKGVKNILKVIKLPVSDFQNNRSISYLVSFRLMV